MALILGELILRSFEIFNCCNGKTNIGEIYKQAYQESAVLTNYILEKFWNDLLRTFTYSILKCTHLKNFFNCINNLCLYHGLLKMKAKYIVYKKKDTSFFFLVNYVQASWWFFLLLNSVYSNYRGRKLYGEQSFLDTLLQQNNEEKSVLVYRNPMCKCRFLFV